ncbi:MAG: iron donor protein CyaY [Betaproteobacteria bacterium]
MNTPIQMAESDFHARVDSVLAAIENEIEMYDGADADIDTEINSGILTLEFDNHSKVIINRQTPNREIWVAAKSGGFHFHFDGAVWRDTRTNESLEALLSRVISAQSGHVIPITL